MTITLWMVAVIKNIFIESEIVAGTIKVLIVLCDLITLVYVAIIGINNYGNIYIALMLYGSVLFLLIGSKSNDKYKPLLFYYIPGIIVSVLSHIASNARLEVIPVGLVLAAIACTMWGEQLIREFRGYTYSIFIKGLVCGAFIVCIVVTTVSRIKFVYRDDKLLNLMSRIEEGPARGVYTTKEHCQQYKDVYDTVQALNAYCVGGETFFCSKLAPWVYLCTNMKCGAYTTWRIALDDERLFQYYEEEGYFPDYVLVLDDEYGSYVTDYITTSIACDDANVNSEGGGVSDILKDDSNYKRTEVSCGVLYRRNND